MNSYYNGYSNDNGTGRFDMDYDANGVSPLTGMKNNFTLDEMEVYTIIK